MKIISKYQNTFSRTTGSPLPEAADTIWESSTPMEEKMRKKEAPQITVQRVNRGTHRLHLDINLQYSVNE